MELKSYFAQHNGNKIGGAQIDVYMRDTTDHAPELYDVDGNSLENPFNADGDGLIQFLAPNGLYDLRVSLGPYDYTMPIQCLDVTETLESAAEQLAVHVNAAAGSAEAAGVSAGNAADYAAAADAAAADAVSSQLAAEAAVQAALSAGNIYQSTAAGLAATASGQYFTVIGQASDVYLSLYLNSSGTAVLQKYSPSTQALQAIVARVDSLSAQVAGGDPVARSMLVEHQSRLNAIDNRLSVVESGNQAGWLTAARIAADGWYIELDMPASRAGGTFDPSKITLTSYDWGFDVVGGQVQRVIRSRAMHPTVAKRKPYPDHAQDEATTVGGTVTFQLALPLQMFSKASATAAGGTGHDPVIAVATGYYTAPGSIAAPGQVIAAANNSTEGYPAVVAQLQTPPRRLIDTTSVFETLGAGHGAQQGRPLVAARLTVSGATSGASVTKTITALSVSAFGTQKTCKSIAYAATLTSSELALFAQGEELTERWEHFPWIGDDASVLDSAAGNPASLDCSSNIHICNKSLNYPTIYACVDVTSGSDTSGVASATESTAVAAPFQHDHFAVYAAHVAGVSAYGSGKYRVIIDFKNGDHQLMMEASNIYSPTVRPSLEDLPSGGLCPTWTIYRPTAGAASARLVSSSASGNGLVPPRTCVEGLTMHASVSGRNVISRGQSSAGNADSQIWLKDLSFSDAALAVNLHLYKAGYVWMTGCSSVSATVNGYILGRYGNDPTQWKLGRDLDFAVLATPEITPSAMNGVRIGNIGAGKIGFPQPATTLAQSNDGFVIANVAAYRSSGNAIGIPVAITKGIALLNVLTETVGAGTQPAWRIGGDGENAEQKNIHVLNSGYVGARGNFGYEDSFTMNGAGQKKKLYQLAGSYLESFNHKDDVFQGVGGRIHTWNIGHHVGFHHNTYLKGSFDGSIAPGRSNWIGEAFGPDEQYLAGRTSDTTFASGIFVSYQAGNVGAGGGDYTPVAGSLLPMIKAADVVVGIDLFGTARRTDGASRPGPIEVAS